MTIYERIAFKGEWPFAPTAYQLTTVSTIACCSLAVRLR